MTSVVERATAQLTAYKDQFSTNHYLLINITEQTLNLIRTGKVQNTYRISTAANGVGFQEGSGKTPSGIHRIAQKLGDEAESGVIFKARQNTGIIAPVLNSGEYSSCDAITSRILWLDGLETDKNKGGQVDSFSRYIYIHGTAEEWRLGRPVSHGCIRMANQAVIELYDKVSVNTLVVIIE